MSTIPDSADSFNSVTQPNSSLPIPPPLSESPEITRPFKCFHCAKRFSSTHALGGHQNAHKRERNEERSFYVEQRFALKRQALVTVPSPAPDLSVVIHDDSAKCFGHLAQLAGVLTNSVPSQTPILVQPLAAGFIYGCPNPPVLRPVGFEYGPTMTEVKGGEENQNYHPYKKPVDTKTMPWKPYTHEERDFGVKAEHDSSCFREYYPASTTTDAGSYAEEALIIEGREDAAENISMEEELDLTLRL